MPAANVFKQHTNYSAVRSAVAALVALLTTALGVFSAVPVLSRLELIGSSRGLALTIGADAPFPLTMQAEPAGQKNGSTIALTCASVVYGLGDYRFTAFPHSCPIKQIVAHEIKGENAVVITVTLLSTLEKNARMKQKDNRWVILLSSMPITDFAWAAPSGSDRPAQPPVEGARPAQASPGGVQVRPAAASAQSYSTLEDIAIMHRERVEKVMFSLSGPTEMIVKNMADRIVVLFVNTKNGLSHATFKSDKDWLVQSIELKEVAHGGTAWLGASIFIRQEDGVRPLVLTLPDRLVVYSVRESKQCLYLWTARNGTTLSYDFIAPQRYQVDYRHIEQKALSDAKAEVGKSGTFSVGESPANKTGRQAAAVQDVEPKKLPDPPRIVRMVILRDNVNLRSQPSSDKASAVLSRLSLGAIGTRLAKKGLWVNLDINGSRGWVLTSLALDSATAPRTFWNKIEAARLEKEKRELKAQEAMREKQEKAAAQLEKKRQEEITRTQRRVADSAAAAVAAAKKTAAPPQVQRTAPSVSTPAAGAQKDTLASKKTETSGEKVITYQAFGRDPFLPLIQDEDGPLLNIENIELVGILYDAIDRIGLFEDVRNKKKAYALREKEPIKNGFVSRILPDKVLFSLNELGISRTYAMKLNKDKDLKALKEPEPAREGKNPTQVAPSQQAPPGPPF